MSGADRDPSVPGVSPGVPSSGGTHPHCEDLAERIEQFLDGALDADQTRELDEHLDDCLPCTSERELRARIRELVREGCAERAPADLVDRVRARLSAVAVGPETGEAGD